jgi:hypothetical protein
LVDVRQHSELQFLPEERIWSSFLTTSPSAHLLLPERGTAPHHTLGEATPGAYLPASHIYLVPIPMP